MEYIYSVLWGSQTDKETEALEKTFRVICLDPKTKEFVEGSGEQRRELFETSQTFRKKHKDGIESKTLKKNGYRALVQNEYDKVNLDSRSDLHSASAEISPKIIKNRIKKNVSEFNQPPKKKVQTLIQNEFKNMDMDSKLRSNSNDLQKTISSKNKSDSIKSKQLPRNEDKSLKSKLSLEEENKRNSDSKSNKIKHSIKDDKKGDTYSESNSGKSASFKCSQCGDIFSSESSLRKHRSIHQMESRMMAKNKNIFRCLICKKNFDQNAKLMVHRHSHTQSCNFCNICHKRVDDLRNHRMEVHQLDITFSA